MFFQLRMPKLHLVCNVLFHLLPVHLGLLGYDDDDVYITILLRVEKSPVHPHEAPPFKFHVRILRGERGSLAALRMSVDVK